MSLLDHFRQITPAQRHAYFASLGGWTLDAFDFFIFVLCLNAISADFHTSVQAAAQGIALTLAMRPVGAVVAFETLPAKGRGFFSGLLQEGYVLGFLLASLVSRFAFEHVGWRGMFV